MFNTPAIRPPPGDAPEHEKGVSHTLTGSHETPALLSKAGGHPHEGNRPHDSDVSIYGMSDAGANQEGH